MIENPQEMSKTQYIVSVNCSSLLEIPHFLGLFLADEGVALMTFIRIYYGQLLAPNRSIVTAVQRIIIINYKGLEHK